MCFFNLNFVNCTGRWFPVFTDYDGDGNVQVPNFYFAVGVPECGRMQMWPIYYYPTVSVFFSILILFQWNMPYVPHYLYKIIATVCH